MDKGMYCLDTADGLVSDTPRVETLGPRSDKGRIWDGSGCGSVESRPRRNRVISCIGHDWKHTRRPGA